MKHTKRLSIILSLVIAIGAGIIACGEEKKTEIDLTTWGSQWAGYIAMGPSGAEVENDDGFLAINLPDDEYLKVSSADFWSEAVGVIEKSSENVNFKRVSDTVVRYERDSPLGKIYVFDVLVNMNGQKYSCEGESFEKSAADRLTEICTSITKK